MMNERVVPYLKHYSRLSPKGVFRLKKQNKDAKAGDHSPVFLCENLIYRLNSGVFEHENDHIIPSTYAFSRPFLKNHQLVIPEIFYRGSIGTYKYAHRPPTQALGVTIYFSQVRNISL